MNDPTTTSDVKKQATAIFAAHIRGIRAQIDRVMAGLMIAQWVAAIGIAVTFSPYAWEGTTRSLHPHIFAAIVLGGAITSLPVVLAIFQPGAVITRHVVAVAQMLWSALLIHLTDGRVETHFHIFGSLAFLAFYRDAWVLLPATLVIGGDHVVRQFLWPESVYGITNPEWWRFLEHVWWVAFEDVFLVASCIRGTAELRDLARQQAELQHLSEQERHKERLEKELEIAGRLQTAILPTNLTVPQLSIAARMEVASEVGGDLYDVLPRGERGAWIAIGDVAGHGLPAGVVMLMVRTGLAALVERDPNESPAAILTRLNRLIHEAVKERLRTDEHVTLCLLRHDGDGNFVYAGAHEDILIRRQTTGLCDRIETEGTWLALRAETGSAFIDRSLHLNRGDTMLLMTDGLHEAERMDGAMYGVEAVMKSLEAVDDKSSSERMLDAVLNTQQATVRERSDDVTLLVVQMA